MVHQHLPLLATRTVPGTQSQKTEVAAAAAAAAVAAVAAARSLAAAAATTAVRRVAMRPEAASVRRDGHFLARPAVRSGTEVAGRHTAGRGA